MDIKVRTALISTGLNTLLSLMKFFLFAVTGSFAILADAWHGISDIGTSLLVLITVRRTGPAASGLEDGEQAAVEAAALDPAGDVQHWGLRARAFLRATSAEHYAALAIGLLLSFVAIGLLWKVLFVARQQIERPLLSGLLFLCFAAGSYFVYRFETAVGQRTGSVGLVSDGLHSKADMIGTLLTGASLIVYALGLDVDRPVAVLNSLFVMAFGVETLAMTLMSRLGHERRPLTHLRTVELLVFAFDKQKVKHVLQQFEAGTGLRLLHGARRCRRFLRLLRWPVLAGALTGYLTTCVYTVGPTEQAVLLRFGRPATQGTAVPPGLHLKCPWPVDEAVKIDAFAARRRTIGNVMDEQSFALLWTQAHGSEEPFLTGDNSFFFPYLIVHYRVRDVFQFVINQSNPEEFLDALALNRATDLFAGTPFDLIVGQGRSALETKLADDLQARLDRFETGIEILGVHFRDMHPPISIADSFERVIAARQEKEQLIDKAHGYRNQSLPENRGEAARMVESASAYANDRIRHAEGDAGRFTARLVPDSQARSLTIRRLYLDSMSEALAGAEVVLVDPGAGTPNLILNKTNMATIR